MAVRTAQPTESRMQHLYVAIDLKSFYASVECAERGLDPLTTNLVVADATRTSKTICLAVSPSLKAQGIPGRPRLFEVEQRIAQINAQRKAKAAAQGTPWEKLTYIVAPPQMKKYMEISSSIYAVYLKYVAPEDVLVYSIDEVFIDVAPYLSIYHTDAHGLARKMIRDVLATTGITATCGIGTNMYLAKVAMDIVAKHMPADNDGVRIAQLDEMSYRHKLWTHRPLTDFWRVGPGYATKLEQNGMYTMGDVARRSLDDEDSLYDLFGVNAEYLIDHAWGIEPITIAQAHAYKPQVNTLSTGQVLPCPYTHDKCRIIVREMAEELSYSLLEKGLVTDAIALDVGFDRSNTEGSDSNNNNDGYEGPLATDFYGRIVPAHAHGTIALPRPTTSAHLISQAALAIFDAKASPKLSVRRLYVVALNVSDPQTANSAQPPEQLNLFEDPEQAEEKRVELDEALEREQRMQEKVADIRRKFGKNALIKGTDLLEGARTIERNGQVGGHRG